MVFITYISFAILIIFIAIFLYAGVPLIYSRVAKFALARKAIKSKALVLTFDDGPGNRLTPAILNVLTEFNAKATFFLLGRNIAGREQIVRQIAAQGHEICSHGFNHLHAWKVWPWQSIQDIKKGWQSIDRALGIRKGTYPFRPPYGKLNLVTLLYLWSKGVLIIYWTADIGDTWSEEQRNRLLDREFTKLREGAVVLAHDFDRATDNMDKYIVEAVCRCISTAQESQLEIRPISELGIVAG